VLSCGFAERGDDDRAGVQSVLGQLLAQPDDQLDRGRIDGARRGLRPPRPRPERRLSLGPVAGYQPADPALRHPIGASHLALGAPLDNDSGNDQTRLRHPTTLTAHPFPCLERCHSDVLRDHTATPTQASEAYCNLG
jgi:hypothetical protein